jgi:hypothetical protein
VFRQRLERRAFQIQIRSVAGRTNFAVRREMNKSREEVTEEKKEEEEEEEEWKDKEGNCHYYRN